jgi:hypothetical protein
MYLELFDNYLWFHTDIFKWTKEVKKKYTEDLNKLEDLVSVPLMALITEDNHKLAKFAKVLNWQSKGQIMLNNGSKGFIYASKRIAGE